MAKSYSARRQNSKADMKHKSYSKLSMDKNILAFVKEGHSLKPCYVSLTRIDAETYLANVKHNSHVLKQTVGISFTMNDEIHSKGLKNSCINLDEFQKTTGVLRKSLHSKGSVKNVHNSSASCSFVTAHDHSVIKPCYIKLERLNTAVKRHCLDFSEKISTIKKIKLWESNTSENYENISSSSKYLTHEEHLSQPGDADVGCRSNESQEGSSEMKLLKPCIVRVMKLIGKEPVSNMNRPVFSSDSCKMNKLVDADDSMTGSFVSDSLLSTPSSLGDYEVNKRTEKLDELILSSNSLKSDANKKMGESNDGQSPLSKSTPGKFSRLLFCDSSSSEFDANIVVRVSDDNENSVERSARLLPSASCSSLEFDAEKKISEMDDDVLKCPTKQKAALLPSSSSSECSTGRNTPKYCTKNRRSAFSQRRNRRRNIPFKRDSSHLHSYNSSSDSSSTVVNCSIATFNSFKQGLTKRNIESLGTSSVISSRTTTNGNVTEKIKPVSCSKYQRTNTKIGESSAHKCESLCSSETEENFSHNYFHQSNNNADAGNLEHKHAKYSSKRRKHFVVNGTHSSSEDKCEVQVISSEERTASNLSENKSNNTETERNCNVSPNYNLKPCYVTLNRVEKIGLIGKVLSEKSSYIHEDDLLKPVSQAECVELNCSKQIKSFRSTNTSKMYKSMNNSQRDRSFGENNDSVFGEECRVLTDSESEKDWAEPCTDYATHRNSVDQLQDDYATDKNSVDQLQDDYATNKNSVDRWQDSSDESGHQASSCKQFSKPVYYFSDDSDSLPDIATAIDNSKHPKKSICRKVGSESDDLTIENHNRILKNHEASVDAVIHNSKHLKKNICRKSSSESNDLTIENHYRILNNHEAGVVTEDNDETRVATDIDNASNRSGSPVKSENNNFAGRENCDPDYDDAYLADTDDYSDSDFVENDNSNNISQDNDETSVGLRVNLSGSKNEVKSIPRRIPYCCLGSKNVLGKHFDSMYLFKSKSNGNVYIVDIFEVENIKKMFVTIKLKKKKNLYGNTLFEKRNLPTLSERMNSLGCFDEENARIYYRNPFIFANIDRSQHENELNCLEKQNPSPDSTSHLVGKDTVLSASGNCSKSSDDACTEPSCSKPSCSQSSEFKNLTVSSTSSDSSDSTDDEKFNNHCVHCFEKFSNKKEDFNHTCEGKLQKGFLCMYCEKIFSSYSRLLSHKQLHFI